MKISERINAVNERKTVEMEKKGNTKQSIVKSVLSPMQFIQTIKNL